jgi:hypothetical protein
LGHDRGHVEGGVLHHDLKEAASQALRLPRAQARARAMAFGWQETVHQFMVNLVAVRSGAALDLSHFRHKMSAQSVL